MTSLLRVALFTDSNYRKFLLAFCAAARVGWCLPANQPMLEVRLQTHLTSYASFPGDQFRSVVTSALEVDGRVVIPRGSTVYGTVLRASAVGLGLVRERAVLRLNFHEYETPDGRRFPLQTRLHSIDNAREQVTPRGEIKGVVVSARPHSLIYGVWHRPSPTLLYRSLIGLTGASGQIWARYSLGPLGAASLFVMRSIAFPFPEPEIHFAPGTDMKLVVTTLPEDVFSLPSPSATEVPEPLASCLQSKPYGVEKPDRRPAADAINLAFVGSRQQLRQAFTAAGWFPAEPLTRQSFSRAYAAYTSMRGYATAPVSKLLYGGAATDFVFEKSLNTITKRHHVRTWNAGSFEGQELWLGAATHDTGIAFNRRGMNFTHKIDSAIDLERTKIINDLAFAGCTAPVAYLDRPVASRAIENGKGVASDGRLAVLLLKDCAGPSQLYDPAPQPPGSKAKRLTRRVLLEARDSLLRENPYYWGYRAIQWCRLDRSRRPSTIDD